MRGLCTELLTDLALCQQQQQQLCINRIYYLLLGVSSAYEQYVPGSGLPGDQCLHGELAGAVLLQVEQQQRQVRLVQQRPRLSTIYFSRVNKYFFRNNQIFFSELTKYCCWCNQIFLLV